MTDLLWRHVTAGAGTVLLQADKTKVKKLCTQPAIFPFAKPDIGRLDITVQNTTGMNEVQRLRQVPDDLQAFLQGELLFLKCILQRAARQKREYQNGAIAKFFHLIDG